MGEENFEDLEDLKQDKILSQLIKEKKTEARIKRKRNICALRSLEKGERVSHFDEIPRIRRVIAQLEGVIKMIEGRGKSKCNIIINQLLSANSVLRNIGLFMLNRHIKTCLKEEGFLGSERERDKELSLAYQYLGSLIDARNIESWIEEETRKKLKKETN